MGDLREVKWRGTVWNQIAEDDDKMRCEKLETEIRLIFQEWLRKAVGWQRKLQG